MVTKNQIAGVLFAALFVMKASNALGLDYFVEIPKTPAEVFAGQQFDMKLQLWDAVDATGARFLAFDWKDIDVFPDKSQRMFNSSVNGRLYRVTEMRLKAVVKKAGKQYFPQICVARIVKDTSVQASEAAGEKVLVEEEKDIATCTDPFAINVKPLPKNVFPAEDVAVLSGILPESGTVAVGSPLKRSLVLKATGTLPAYLPDLIAEEIPFVKIYDGQLVQTLDKSQRTIVAEAKRTTVYIPEKAGKIVLPEIRFSWLNTLTGRLEKGYFPAETITVVEAANPDNPIRTAEAETPQKPPSVSVSFKFDFQKYKKYLPSLLYAFAVVLSSLAIKKMSRPTLEKRRLRINVFNACEQNDLKEIEQSLILWAEADEMPSLNLSELGLKL